ncbi:MAG TPA: hypothetical protein VFB12_13930 [Ktedonobacteraceae bacterium]|nr:hypothetical protein [Ktedonobacteraceae bacterium]
MSDQELEHARTVSRQIVDRIKADPTFKDQVIKDPMATLTAAGLPEKYVGEFLHETRLADVAGYAAHTWICIALTISI